MVIFAICSNISFQNPRFTNCSISKLSKNDPRHTEFLVFFVAVSFYVKNFHGRRFYSQNPLLYMSAVTISRHARNCGPNYDFQVTSLSSNITYHHIMFRNYHGNPNPPCSHTRKCASEVPMMLTFEHLRTGWESGSLPSIL